MFDARAGKMSKKSLIEQALVTDSLYDGGLFNAAKE